MGQELHEPFGGQHLERFAQRRARDVEPFAQLAFGNPRARRDLAVEQMSRMRPTTSSCSMGYLYFECKNDQ